MKTATTKEVRKLVKDAFGIKGACLDKASEDHMRLMMFYSPSTCQDPEFLARVTKVFRDNGFDNRVKVTGDCYLRIKAVFDKC